MQISHKGVGGESYDGNEGEGMQIQQGDRAQVFTIVLFVWLPARGRAVRTFGRLSFTCEDVL